MIDGILDSRILVVVIPLPPDVEVNGLIHMDDAFASKTYDIGFDRDHNDFTIIDMIPTIVGPAILISTRVRELIFLTDREESMFESYSMARRIPPAPGTIPFIAVQRPACCANVSYYQETIGGQNYGIDTVINSLSLVTSSCHPGSHISIPEAPFLTAAIQHHCGFSRRADMNKRFISPMEAKTFFPSYDYSKNMVVDSFIGQCRADIRNCMGQWGTGDWAIPYFKQFRVNAILGASDERTIVVAGQENGGRVGQNANAEGTSGTLCGEGYRIVDRRGQIPSLRIEQVAEV